MPFFSRHAIEHTCKSIHHLQYSESPATAQFSSVQSLSHVQLFATPWTAAHQAPPSMGFSRQEQEEKGMTDNEMVGWQHQLNGDELE